MARVYGGYFLFQPVTKGKRADGIIGPVRFVPYMPEKKNSQASQMVKWWRQVATTNMNWHKIKNFLKNKITSQEEVTNNFEKFTN